MGIGSFVAKLAYYYIDDVSLTSCHSLVSQEDFLGNDTSICEKAPLQLLTHQDDSLTTYTWQDGSHFKQFNVKATGAYWVDVSNFGCPPARDSIYVEVMPAPELILALTQFCVSTKIFCCAPGRIIMIQALHTSGVQGIPLPISCSASREHTGSR